jgi:D-isomer specific 2-hydroxyacid dehydrogenase, NAD binding domain
VQHLLETTGSLFESLIHLGLKPEHTYVLGKLYSACPSVEDKLRRLGVKVFENKVPDRFGAFCDQFKCDVEALWDSAIRDGVFENVSRVVILDDGGYAIAQTPKLVYDRLSVHGVEQTMSGIKFIERVSDVIPIVDVASSAAKTLLEPELIREAVFKRVSSGVIASSSVGVIGLGNIGFAVASALKKSHRPVYVYDRDIDNVGTEWDQHFFRCESISEVFANADVIFGCTGTDFLNSEPWWKELSGDKTLISCSSHDQEFRTLLESVTPNRVADRAALFSTATVLGSSGTLSILRGGFPINFDGSAESVPAPDIQLTRGLLMAGTIQAARNALVLGLRGRQPLSAAAQKSIVRRWFSVQPNRKLSYPSEWLRIFADEQSILLQSACENANTGDYCNPLL